MQLVRKTIAAFLIFNTLLGILWQPLVYADFKLRQDYIAEVLCIKKDQPMTVCGGNCVLADRLNQVDPPAEQNTPQRSSTRLLEINFFQQKHKTEIPHRQQTQLQQPHGNYSSFTLCSGYALDVFNPPQPS